MEKLRTSYLDSQVVAEAVLGHLWRQDTADTPALHLTGSPLLLQKLWSTIYFLTVIDSGERRELVAKIAHFPDQASPEISWQSEELLIRGRREFDTLARISAHFACQPDRLLTALQPRAYLPEINAVVMDFVSGQTLYDGCIAMRHLLTAAGRRRAKQVMYRVGQWLRWFHRLPLENAPQERTFGPPDAFAALLNAVAMLRPFGIDPAAWPQWPQTLAVLSQVVHPKQVWAHGDFHLRNVLVVRPNDAVLGLDTALERVDSPYFDLGKFVADLKTRRDVILRGGLLPPPGVVQSLTQAFLSGYLGEEPLAVLPLALYEGRFIFQKWAESLIAIRDTFHGRSGAPLGVTIGNNMINLTFQRLIKQWMGAVTAAAYARPGLKPV